MPEFETHSELEDLVDEASYSGDDTATEAQSEDLVNDLAYDGLEEVDAPRESEERSKGVPDLAYDGLEEIDGPRQEGERHDRDFDDQSYDQSLDTYFS